MNKYSVSSPVRLLSFVKDKFDLSVKDLRWSIEHGRCFVNGRIERFTSTRLNAGDEVAFFPIKRPQIVLEESRTLYENEEILIYNKPPYISSTDLATLFQVKLVHRLDRDTTGIILFAKKNLAYYQDLFRNRRVKKTYHTIVEGVPKNKNGTFSAKMSISKRREGAVKWGVSQQGLLSITKWKLETSTNRYSLIRCQPITGRTHQIRVHMTAMGHPILGDSEYGSKTGIAGLFRPLLHASELQFDAISLSVPFPEDFTEWTNRLNLRKID